MSGIIGHLTYAVLGHKAAAERQLPVAPIIGRHYASYLAGCYLGADIMTLPGGACAQCGEEWGYSASAPEQCPNDGGSLRPYVLPFDGADYSPQDIHRMFYGRTHLVFGWSPDETAHTLSWDALPNYFASVVRDALEFFGPGERPLAYLFGWMTHVVGDALIKSVQPGLTLYLLNGTYTPQNRPIQDLFSFHEVGRKELGLNWQALLSDLVETPVEPIQAHFMRLAPPRGALAQHFPDAWKPTQEKLLLAVMAENRRYQHIRNSRLLAQLALTDTPDGQQCDPELSGLTGGLTYAQMVELAEQANFRHALWQIGEAIAERFEAATLRQTLFQDFPISDGPTWKALTDRWCHDKMSQ
ncbi:MAG: hypothetical protein O7E52_16985 [Candidatus Poribacteria bacterium]|nr:hypothetical protein [Candidatus Poribacteria bacterium]